MEYLLQPGWQNQHTLAVVFYFFHYVPILVQDEKP